MFGSQSAGLRATLYAILAVFKTVRINQSGKGRSTMKKLFLTALAFMFALVGSELAAAHNAAAQDNQNTQVKTSVSDTTYHRRRHRRRHLRHTVVSKTKNVTEKSKEVGEATVDKSKSVGSAVVDKSKTVGEATADKSKTVGNTVAEKSKTVGRRSKHIGRKVVHKTKKTVTPQ
ncbi:MAG: hypothetical protein DMF76_06740 [Acidobacteria bacterium]|nr:MAG: hypothetical protein DMF76_06740 [Acidobacteriota bacterium]